MSNSPSVFRWGILGTGNIAHQFARALTDLPGHRLQAVGSRSAEKARAFADEFAHADQDNVRAHASYEDLARDQDNVRAHASYEDLARDPEVDAIYIATPHPAHAPNALMCLLYGKHLLVEKPFTLNAQEAEAIILTARDKGLFVMEAMWTRFFPLMDRVREMIRDGAIGEPRMLQADFGYRSDKGPEHRHLNRKLGGGALLDVGVYPLSLAHMLFGPPEKVAGVAHMGVTGVDEEAAITTLHEDGRIACLTTAVVLRTPQEAHILGTAGRIHANWWQPKAMTLTRADGSEELIEVPYEGNGYRYEAEEAARCIRAGMLESPLMTLQETLDLMRTMDTLRASWGLKYPGE